MTIAYSNLFHNAPIFAHWFIFLYRHLFEISIYWSLLFQSLHFGFHLIQSLLKVLTRSCGSSSSSVRLWNLSVGADLLWGLSTSQSLEPTSERVTGDPSSNLLLRLRLSLCLVLSSNAVIVATSSKLVLLNSGSKRSLHFALEFIIRSV